MAYLDVLRSRKMVVLALLSALIPIIVTPTATRALQQTKPSGAEPVPQPAIPGILAAFDKYEVVAMPEAHGQKDLDDFVLSLIRNPGFPDRVNDIEVECGNLLYQPVLDRYIAGEDVPFTEVRKVWRNTTQPMCGVSGFFEQFFPLIRAINQKLPPAKRLRVLAGDPPIDWEKVKSAEDVRKFGSRNSTIASVMEKAPGSAVASYEKDYPNRTFIISDLTSFDKTLPASWPFPSLVPAKGTWLGALDLGHFFPAPVSMDEQCQIRNEFPKELQKPIDDLVDAFLYLSPEGLALNEQIPADIVLDSEYWTELKRREALCSASPNVTSRRRVPLPPATTRTRFSRITAVFMCWFLPVPN